MKEILDFLAECKVFFVASIDGDQPRVRPFSFVMEFDGKLTFCTGNKKPFWEQITKNPKVEISASTTTGKWLRLSGSIVQNTTKEAKEKAFEVEPFLKNMYSLDDGIFEIFHVENGVATIFSMSGENKTFNL